MSNIVVIGGGAAGLSLSLRLAEAGAGVVVLAKGRLSEGSSYYAQGGIAAVRDADDSFQYHIRDTLIAGAGLCHKDAVEQVVTNGPDCIQWLIDHGVGFSRDDKDQGRYHLTREGGHSHRRIIHSADATGREVETSLVNQARKHPNIQILEHHLAFDIITSNKLGLPGPNHCLGLYALNQHSGKVISINTPRLVLATGGAAKVYLYTSNPDTCTGDGIALAWRAGCRVANLEFIQFHPTCLYHPQAKSFLISEALRGEGALLTLPDGGRFMPDHDERAELAPRDIVARAIDYEMKKRGLDHVLLDISYKPADFIREHFPTIYQRCLEYGFDLTQEAIPVVPAAHYTCGGIMIDPCGCTDVEGLYAIGECTFTGLHGANRLASNSLLECLVYGKTASAHILSQSPNQDSGVTLPEWDESRVSDADEQIVVAHNWDELRRAMWDYVGIVRTSKRLQRAQHRINLLKEEVREYYGNFRVSSDLLELRNLLEVAELIVRSASQRKESRGLHYTLDYPESSEDWLQDTVLTPDEEPGQPM
ncbi:MAG TPA: L-aspartate oxidase [Gammaproteobacteria bacterium]|nr:L-aspartate oxidase [Gammaproteobacteria bacterium]